jgi:multidrug efflux pump subunit AcrB
MENSQQPQEIKREFGLSTWAVENSTSIFILMFISIVFGWVSYQSMPKEQFPEIKMPTIYINTIYPGNSPVDVENLITRHIEKELKSLKGVKKINSTSAQDVSAIIVEFNEDVQVSKALQDVKDAVDKSKSELPTDLDEEPRVIELDFSELPMMVVNLSGDFEIDKLNEYAEYLEDELEALQEVSKVDILGSIEREIQINADILKMEAREVSFGDIESAISSENVTMSSGEVLTEGYRRSLRVFGEFRSMQEIENIIIKHEDDNLVLLKDVAEIKDSYVERKSFARLADKEFAKEGNAPVVSLNVVKRSGENLIEGSQKVLDVIELAKKTKLPPNLTIVSTQVQADDMKAQIANLENSIISGVILVVGVLLFFMGFRNAMFVGIAIPLSMLLSFLVLDAMGISINIVVLFALILALGMLVDNAIVVIENTYRMMENGVPVLQAAKEGVGEVAWPIISSTATTVAAFVPLAFWGGIMGEFMKYLPITLIVTLSASLFVGIFINPVISLVFMKVDKKRQHLPERTKKLAIIGAILFVLSIPCYFIFDTYSIANLLMTFAVLTLSNAFFIKPMTYWFQNTLLVWVEKLYKDTLNYALTGWKPYLFFFGSFFALFASFFLLGVRQPLVTLFPENEPNFIFMYIEAPLGTDTKTMDKITRNIEKKVFEVAEPYSAMIESIITNVGENTGNTLRAGAQSGAPTPHKSKIALSFLKYQYRNGLSTAKLMRELSEMAKTIPGVKIVTEKEDNGPPVGAPISIEVTGDEYLTLIQETDKIKKAIEAANIPGIDGLSMDIETGKPEVLVNIDREKVRRFGLSTASVAMGLRTAIYGKEVSKYKDGDDDHPIQLRLDDKFRYNATALENMRMTFRDNKGKMHQVPISAVANLEYSSTFGEVKRKDLDKVIILSSNVIEGYNGNEVVGQIKTVLANHKIKDGYSFRFGGEQEEMAKSLAFLVNALIIAVAAIFLILVSQFNSAIKPFIIMCSVMFSLSGVLIGMTIMGDDFVIIMTGIGIISLAGVVVNNAIVLIDYTELLRQRRRKELNIPEGEYLPDSEFIACLVEAGFTRLRPVLLTAITTVLGLIPLATGLNIDFFRLYSEFNPDIYWGGENADFWGPMAWTVIYGLTFATFLTLVIVPVMFLLAEKLARFAKHGFGGAKKPVLQ